MPRKNRLQKQPISGGEPMDGDMIDDSRNYAHDEPDEPDDEPTPPKADELAELRAEVERLKKQVPPPEPVRRDVVADPVDEMSDEDFDALLFSNPREALRLNNERVKKELRSEYTNEQGTKSFWDQFYSANADLKEDDDLVQSTLQKNMAELGNMPVPKAMERLAVLTRDRILGFMKKRKDPRPSRAIAEGATPPAIPNAPAEDDGRETTMSDLIKSRRAARRKAALAA